MWAWALPSVVQWGREGTHAEIRKDTIESARPIPRIRKKVEMVYMHRRSTLYFLYM